MTINDTACLYIALASCLHSVPDELSFPVLSFCAMALALWKRSYTMPRAFHMEGLEGWLLQVTCSRYVWPSSTNWNQSSHQLHAYSTKCVSLMLNETPSSPDLVTSTSGGLGKAATVTNNWGDGFPPQHDASLNQPTGSSWVGLDANYVRIILPSEICDVCLRAYKLGRSHLMSTSMDIYIYT